MQELEALAVARRDERDEAGEALTRARDELARLERSEEAAQAAQAKASLEAQIQELAERYARARLAQRVLRDAIARYRSAHEGPLLARANALFPALTCERYARLETDVDERDEDILIAITADGSRRRVAELSDGTREQLFLALRLAAIERHVATAEAVPVLFDDVLLESDDERAQRILAALAELATQTQVLVLTHHRHLVEIARATLPKRRLDVIELSEAAANRRRARSRSRHRGARGDAPHPSSPRSPTSWKPRSSAAARRTTSASSRPCCSATPRPPPVPAPTPVSSSLSSHSRRASSALRAAFVRPTSFGWPRCSMNPSGPTKALPGMSCVAAYSVGSAPISSLWASSRLPIVLKSRWLIALPVWLCRCVLA